MATCCVAKLTTFQQYQKKMFEGWGGEVIHSEIHIKVITFVAL
jgi:hypothetical protein